MRVQMNVTNIKADSHLLVSLPFVLHVQAEHSTEHRDSGTEFSNYWTSIAEIYTYGVKYFWLGSLYPAYLAMLYFLYSLHEMQLFYIILWSSGRFKGIRLQTCRKWRKMVLNIVCLFWRQSLLSGRKHIVFRHSVLNIVFLVHASLYWFLFLLFSLLWHETWHVNDLSKMQKRSKQGFQKAWKFYYKSKNLELSSTYI